MSTGTIITKRLKSGKRAYLLKYDAGPDPDTGERRQCYKQLSGPEWNKRKAGEELRRLLTDVDTGDYRVGRYLGYEAGRNAGALMGQC